MLERRYVEGKLARYPALAAELVALKVDVIVASGGTPAALAAKEATGTLPIVFVGVGDPVTSRLVTSLARPGGNATGLSFLAPELVGKRLELPEGSDPTDPRNGRRERPCADFCSLQHVPFRALGVRLQVVEARGTRR